MRGIFTPEYEIPERTGRDAAVNTRCLNVRMLSKTRHSSFETALSEAASDVNNKNLTAEPWIRSLTRKYLLPSSYITYRHGAGTATDSKTVAPASARTTVTVLDTDMLASCGYSAINITAKHIGRRADP
jgi:hypothetical protein